MKEQGASLRSEQEDVVPVDAIEVRDGEGENLIRPEGPFSPRGREVDGLRRGGIHAHRATGIARDHHLESPPDPNRMPARE